MGGFQFMQPFDARTVDPTAFPPPPPMADYKVMIIRSEAKQTNDKSGGYLELSLLIIEGAYQNREVPYRLNLLNENPQTVEIAKKQLSAVAHVTGQMYLSSSAQLHNIPFIAMIGPQKEDERYARVYLVKDLQGNIPGKPNTLPPTAAPPMPPGMPPGMPAQPAAPGWSPTPAATVPPMPPAPPAAAPFPPAGWAPHPNYPGWYYRGQEVKSEADLRAMAPPAAPPAPAVPVAPAAPLPGASGSPMGNFAISTTTAPPAGTMPGAPVGAPPMGTPGQPPWQPGTAPATPAWAMPR